MLLVPALHCGYLFGSEARGVEYTSCFMDMNNLKLVKALGQGLEIEMEMEMEIEDGEDQKAGKLLVPVRISLL